MNDNPMHYCPGCSHGVVHKLIAEVIEEMGMEDKTIWRNTIYRVFATLKGPGNMEYDIVVDEWKDTEVAIPW